MITNYDNGFRIHIHTSITIKFRYLCGILLLKFEGKTILITGSGTGIGLAIAKKFAQNGASVIILGRRKEPLDIAATALKEIITKTDSGGATVTTFSGVDVSDEQGVTNMFDTIKNSGIIIDCIINNAGVSGPVTCLANASLDQFRSTVDIHLTGTFWCSVQALRVMKQGGKIITISTFFTEERPLEQRPYRFRTPYTASQGAKNRLAELMSWELVDSGIISIATNPGPVHSDRIYKTVYPKAAAEFMRVSGFADMLPHQVETTAKDLLLLLGEDSQTVQDGITSIAQKMINQYTTQEQTIKTLTQLLEKIQTIAEKIQKNTSRMIVDQEFLTQDQVAESVLNLCDDQIATILNGKVIPGDRVFYPVKPHVGASAPTVPKPNLANRSIVITADPTNQKDAQDIISLAKHAEECGARVACFVSDQSPIDTTKQIESAVHTHVVNLNDPEQITRWFNTAQTNLGDIQCVVHFTGRFKNVAKITESTRDEWDKNVAKFITRPATVIKMALEHFVPKGDKDPRAYKDADGNIMIVGPGLPTGKKTTGIQRAQVEVFRGALRPLTTTANQELSDVLKSKIRLFLALPGSVTGAEPDIANIAKLLDFAVYENLNGKKDSVASSIVSFCIDESR